MAARQALALLAMLAVIGTAAAGEGEGKGHGKGKQCSKRGKEACPTCLPAKAGCIKTKCSAEHPGYAKVTLKSKKCFTTERISYAAMSYGDERKEHVCKDNKKSKDDEVEFLAKCGSSITLFLQDGKYYNKRGDYFPPASDPCSKKCDSKKSCDTCGPYTVPVICSCAPPPPKAVSAPPPKSSTPPPKAAAVPPPMQPAAPRVAMPPPQGAASTPPLKGAASTPPPKGAASTPPPKGTASTPPPKGAASTPPPKGAASTPPPKAAGTPPAMPAAPRAAMPPPQGAASTPPPKGPPSTPPPKGAATTPPPKAAGTPPAMPAAPRAAVPPPKQAAFTPPPPQPATTAPTRPPKTCTPKKWNCRHGKCRNHQSPCPFCYKTLNECFSCVGCSSKPGYGKVVLRAKRCFKKAVTFAAVSYTDEAGKAKCADNTRYPVYDRESRKDSKFVFSAPCGSTVTLFLVSDSYFNQNGPQHLKGNKCREKCDPRKPCSTCGPYTFTVKCPPRCLRKPPPSLPPPGMPSAPRIAMPPPQAAAIPPKAATTPPPGTPAAKAGTPPPGTPPAAKAGPPPAPAARTPPAAATRPPPVMPTAGPRVGMPPPQQAKATPPPAAKAGVPPPGTPPAAKTTPPPVTAARPPPAPAARTPPVMPTAGPRVGVPPPQQAKATPPPATAARPPPPTCPVGPHSRSCPTCIPSTKGCIKYSCSKWDGYAKVTLKGSKCFDKPISFMAIAHNDEDAHPTCAHNKQNRHDDEKTFYAKCGQEVAVYLSDPKFSNEKGPLAITGGNPCKSTCQEVGNACQTCGKYKIYIDCECTKKPHHHDNKAHDWNKHAIKQEHD